jgi:hypothetical protein
VQRPLTSGTRGWPADQTPWPIGPTLQPLTGWLHRHALQEAITRNPKLEVSGSRIGDRLAMWLGRPANTWRVNNFIKSATPPWTLINTPLPMEFKTPHHTCSSPLVKVSVYK